MKKHKKKLVLHRESVRILSRGTLDEKVAGGRAPLSTLPFTSCDPSRYADCDATINCTIVCV